MLALHHLQEITKWRGAEGIVQAHTGEPLMPGCVELFNEIRDEVKKEDEFEPQPMFSCVASLPISNRWHLLTLLFQSSD